MVLKNNVIDIFNKCIIARGAIAKCFSYLLNSKTTPKYGIKPLDLKAQAPNLKRQVSLTN